MTTLTGQPNAWSDYLMGPGEHDQEYRDMRSQEVYRLLQGMTDWGRYVKLTEYDGTGIANEFSSSDTSNGIGLDAYSQNVTYRLEIRNSGMNIHGAPTLHAFTEGSILFAGPGGLLSQDNGQLYWDNTNNRLAVGNSAPGDTLHVTGNGRVTARMGVGGAPHASITLLVTGTAAVSSQMIVGASTLGAETFNVTGTAAVSSRMGVGGASDGTITFLVTGTANITGDFTVATNKFTVAASSGNTLVAGTFAVTGATTLNGNVTLGDAGADTITITGTSTTFATVASRILADMTNGTHANRFMLQSSTANSTSLVGVLPSGSGTTSGWQAYNGSNPDAAAFISARITSTEAQLMSSVVGAGTPVPLCLYSAAATKRIEMDSTGIGFFAATPAAQPDITGSRGGNAALADLLTSLETLGLITDSSTA